MPSTPATLSASIELPIPPSPSSDLLTSSSTSSSSVAGRQMAASAAAGAPSKSAHSAQLPVSRDVKARLGIIASPVVAHPEQQLAIPSTSNQHRRGPSGGSSPSFVYQSATIDDASSLQPKEDQDAAGSSFSNLTLRKLAMPTNSNTSSSRGVFEAKVIVPGPAGHAIGSNATAVRTIGANDLIEILRLSKDLIGNAPTAAASAFPLIVDIRQRSSFAELRLTNSVNLALPPLIVKRFRKGVGASFQMESFLTGPESREALARWKAANGTAAVVVDEDAGSEEAGLVAEVLRKWGVAGVSADVALLGVGLAAVAELPVASPLVEGERVSAADVMGSSPLVGAFQSPSTDAAVSPVTPSIHATTPTVAAMAAPEAGSCLPMINRALPGITTTQLPGVPCTASPTSALSSTSTPSPWSATTAPSAMSSLLSSPATVMPVALAQPPLGKKKLPRFSIDTSPVAGVAPSPHTNAAIAVAANETVPAALTSLNLNDVLQPSNHPSTPAAALPPFSQIRPYLLLGDDSIPTSPDAVERLKDMGVTHVLNMAKEVDPACGLGRDDQGIVYKSLGIWDDPDQEGVADVVKAGVAFIDHARATHPNPLILVHCKAGRSRSVMIVMAHLIKSERLSLQASYDDVRNKRSGIVPNIGFMVTLMKFEKEMLEECA